MTSKMFSGNDVRICFRKVKFSACDFNVIVRHICSRYRPNKCFNVLVQNCFSTLLSEDIFDVIVGKGNFHVILQKNFFTSLPKKQFNLFNVIVQMRGYSVVHFVVTASTNRLHWWNWRIDESTNRSNRLNRRIDETTNRSNGRLDASANRSNRRIDGIDKSTNRSNRTQRTWVSIVERLETRGKTQISFEGIYPYLFCNAVSIFSKPYLSVSISGRRI